MSYDPLILPDEDECPDIYGSYPYESDNYEDDNDIPDDL